MKNICLILLITSGSLHGQEMVQNGDFENYSACPDGVSQLEKADHWYTFGSTPEYFNTCATHENLLIPYNTSGYQEASTGNGYAGFIPIFGPDGLYREFLGNELVEPLTIGQTYSIEFKVSLGFNEADIVGRACSHLGAKLSTVAYPDGSTPAVDNTSHIVSTSIISDTTNWVTISGTVTADSAYKYLMIGNFYTAAVYDTINVGTVDANRVYYYVEDVSVQRSGTNEIMEEVDLHNISYDGIRKQITISSNQIAERITKIQLYSLTGQLLYSNTKVNTNKFDIDCNSFEHGTYFIHVMNENGKYSKLKIML